MEAGNIPIEKLQIQSYHETPTLRNSKNKPEDKVEIERIEEKRDKGLFFCCGEMIDDRKYQIEDEDGPSIFKASDKQQSTLPSDYRKNPQRVQFYKGPCESKNAFSMCDAVNEDNKFTIVEERYKDYDL